MRFTSLPVELMLVTFDLTDLADLNVLSRTSKSMFDVVGRLLYRRGAQDSARTCRTRILYAAIHGQTNAISKLWSAGISMNGFENYTDSFIRTRENVYHNSLNSNIAKRTALEIDFHPLLAAALFGHVSVLSLLLSEGNVDIDFQDKSGRTALHYAIENDHSHVIRILLERGATLMPTKISPLVFAADVGNRDAVEMVVNELNKRAVPVKVLKTESRNACRKACMKGFDDIVDVLLRHGTDVNLPVNSRGLLFWASSNCHLSTVKVLLKYGAKMESERDCGVVNALFHRKPGEESGEFDPKIVTYLLESGCNVANGGLHACALWRILNEPDNSGQRRNHCSRYFMATQKEKNQIIKLLRKNGFDKKKCRHGCWEGAFKEEFEKKFRKGHLLEYITTARDA
jgi:Ankyrin repeats (3 copies)